MNTEVNLLLSILMIRCVYLYTLVVMMRTNIVLDDSLVAEALELTGTKSKKEVIHLALLKLIESEKNKTLDHTNFVATYIDQPIKIEQFTPLQRNESHER